MLLITKILIALTILISFIIIYQLLSKDNKNIPGGNNSGKDITQNYKKIIDVNNLVQLKDNFLWDNPNNDGTDPTGGIVDYSYGMDKDSSGKIIKNINGDISWNEIKDNPTSKELLLEDDNGIIIKLSKQLLQNNVVGAPRLTSRKLFKGGLFIFDVEHVPIGCGIWPALWLNGFIGSPDQYHQNESNPLYQNNMQKLANSTLGLKETFDHTCTSSTSLHGRKDPHLSKFVGKDIYPMEWPGGGEVDILEQTNFSPTNLISIHGGPKCEVSTSLTDTTFSQSWLSNEYQQKQLRSICGGQTCNNDLIQDANTVPRPTCPKQSADNAGNSQIVVQDSWGENFNTKKGGIYATQWIPKDKIYIWFYPRNLFTKEYLQKNNGPLSETPDPNSWPSEEISPISNKYHRTLIASYILNDKNAITDSCDINFQAIIINITLGGGWGGAVMPNFCSFNGGKPSTNDYVAKCYNASPDKANNNPNGAWDPDNGCYDGARSNDADKRGINSKALFYSEAYFKIKSIKVFQNNKTDQNVW